MASHDELVALIEQYAGSDGIHATALPRVALIRTSKPTEPLHVIHQPALCIVARGRKQVMLGERIYDYDHSEYLVASVDVPIVGQVTEAPYACFRLDLDTVLLSAMLLEIGSMDDGAGSEAPGPGIALGATTPELLDAVIRLLRLLSTPRDIATLGPLVEREILYRLLLGDRSQKLRQIAMADSRLQRVNRAIGWIRKNFTAPFSIEAVTAAAGMSASSLHQHFKAITAMSPLQYQKQIRLQEARRLILAHDMDAATAGHMVGYDSPSQFSREYSRLFGAPPVRDVARLKALQDFGLDARSPALP